MMITYGKGEAMEGRRYLLEELSDGWMQHAMQEQRIGGTTVLDELSEGWYIDRNLMEGSDNK